MKRPLKIGLALVALVVLVVVGGVAYVLSNVNALAKSGIERGGTRALGVATTVKDVDLEIFQGELAIDGLNVANPQGFSSPAFLDLKEGDIAVTLGSLRSDVIEVPRFRLDGITVHLEKKGGSANYRVILDNLAKLKSGQEPPPSSTEKRLIVNDLELSNIRIHVDMLGIGGPVGDVVNPAAKLDIPIERVKLANVGRTGTGVKGTGVTVEQLTSIIVQAVLAAASERGGGILPLDVLNDLKGGVASLGDLSSIPTTIVGKAGETATQAVKEVGEAAEKAVDDAAKKIGEGLGGLLPGSRPEKKEEPKKP